MNHQADVANLLRVLVNPHPVLSYNQRQDADEPVCNFDWLVGPDSCPVYCLLADHCPNPCALVWKAQLVLVLHLNWELHLVDWPGMVFQSDLRYLHFPGDFLSLFLPKLRGV